MDEEKLQFNEELLSWNFPEFDPEPKSNAWYLWFGIIAALLIIMAIFTDNYLFAVIIVLFTLIIFLHNWKRPEDIQFIFTPQALHVGEKKYPLKEIDHFWIVYEPPQVERIYFEFKSSLRPLLGIPMSGNNPLQIREVLLEYLPENLEREDEPFADGMARVLKL